MYFIVKKGLRIAGKNYYPCICYTMNETIKQTVEKLEYEGKASIYSDMVFFQNGRIISTPEAETPKEESLPVTEEPKETESVAEETVIKKGKKAKKVENREIAEIKEEEIDETEGF